MAARCQVGHAVVEGVDGLDALADVGRVVRAGVVTIIQKIQHGCRAGFDGAVQERRRELPGELEGLSATRRHAQRFDGRVLVAGIRVVDERAADRQRLDLP